jgi:hypothetical protein
MFALRVLLPAAALLGFGLYAGCALLTGALDGPPTRRVDVAAVFRRAERLEADRAALEDSLRQADAIRRELIAGDLTLRQAAAAFAEDNARRPPALRRQPHPHFAGTEEERWCVVVIASVENLLWLDPRRDAVVARLRAELEDTRAAPSSPGD